MEQKERESDNIELRSEKMRNVICKVPPRLVSLGTVVITITVLALAVAFYKTPYPISIEATGEVINQRTVQVFVPYKYLYLFDESRTAHVSLEGNDNTSYNCDIISHNAKLIHREDGNYFMATATVSTYGQNTPVLQKYMKADVRIIVSNKTLWRQRGCVKTPNMKILNSLCVHLWMRNEFFIFL